MFKSHQVLTPQKLKRYFGQVLREMSARPQAILITPKCGDKLVLVNADIFEELFDFRHSLEESSGDGHSKSTSMNALTT